MKIVNGIFFCICVLLFSDNLYSQENNNVTNRTHSLFFKTQNIQVKDALNYGLVYNGPNLGVTYFYNKNMHKYAFSYSSEVYFGGLFGKGGGFSWRLKSIDISYRHKLKSMPLTIGAYYSTDYQWQQYPELHGGRLYWFSSLEIGPQITYKISPKDYQVNICFSNSLVGFTSRPEHTSEPYYYSFSLAEFFNVANQKLDFGLINKFNRTKLEIELNRDSWKRFSIGYTFEYYGYYQEPKLVYLCHSLNLNWKINRQ